MLVWYYLWLTIFVVSGVAFAGIAVTVVILGMTDLREMLRGLKTQQDGEGEKVQ